MFNIGFTELILIAAIALVIIGPKNMPQFLRAVGKGLREFRKASNEFKYMVQEEMESHGNKDEWNDIKSLKDDFNAMKGNVSKEKLLDYLEKQTEVTNLKREFEEKDEQNTSLDKK